MVDGGYYSLLEEMVQKFMEEEPNVDVRLSNPLGSGNYNTLEKTIVAGFFKEDYPDIVQCYPDNVVKYLDRGYVVDVSTYMNNDKYGIEGDNYISSFLDEGSSYSAKGTYSLPFCKSTELLYYNADVLLGLDLSATDSSINGGKPLDANYLDNLTWEELFGKLCPAIKTHNSALSDENKIYQDSEDSGIFTYDSDENFFITLANQYGYGYTSFDSNGKGSIDYDNSGMKSLVSTLYEAKNNGYLQTRNTYNDYVSYLFQSRKALFTVSSTAGLSYNFVSEHDQKSKGLTPFSIGVAKIPHSEGRAYSSINQGPSVCVLDHHDENRSLASYLLWKFLTNETNATSWALATGYIGVRDSVYSSSEYKSAITVGKDSDIYTRGAADNLKKIADVKDLTYNTAVFRGSSNARSNVGKLMKACLTSEDLANEIDSLFAASVANTKEYLGN
ncbi:MAG: extracellular solute-binding protein [Bacilli bacterium]|nr:extracellular solute-binding protein [Bacilli bacterium]